MALPVSRLVRVSVNLSPLAASRRSFGILLVAGDSSVINGLERIRSYNDIDSVAVDFGTTAPEYFAAQAYFGQSPKPDTINIGRWIRTASAAQNLGGILSPSQQAIANFNVITNGGMIINVDGTTKTLTGLNFSAQTNLNGVASVIDSALSGASVAFDGTKFIVTSDTTGVGAKAAGSIVFSAAPTANDTLTINTKVLTFVASSPTSAQVLIGIDGIATAANLQAYLQGSVDPLLTVMTYATANGTTVVTYGTIGTAGNAIALSKSSTAITVPATLAGGAVASSVGFATTGSGTDISVLLKLTSATAISLIPGYAAETPVQCASILANKSPNWYGLMFQASVEPTIQQSQDVAAFVQALDIKRIYGVTITDPNVLSSLVTTDLASLLMASGYTRSFTQYSSNAYAIASFFGRAFSVNFDANKSTITLMYKQEPSIPGEELTTDQANTLQAKRCNVFVNYVNSTKIIQYGTMAGPAWFDEIHGLDWFENAVQTDCYNLLYTSPTKIPQTDAGANKFVTTIGAVCDQAVSNQLAAPGVWNQEGFGQLEQGQYLKSGYYIYAQPMALQAQADRDTRVAPPIQVALKLAGAIQELDVIIQVNR